MQSVRRAAASNWRTLLLVAMGLLGAAVAAALIITLGEANRQRDRALRLQSHSYEVMILSRTLSSTMARAEAALGRYVISADRGLGQQFGEDWRLAGQQIIRLQQVTADNAEQRDRVAALSRAYQVRGEELALTALSTRYRKNDQALARFYQARRSPALRDINRLLDDIISRERRLLDERTGNALRSVGQSNMVAAVLAVFGVVIVLGAVVLGWLTVQALGQRAVARAEADAERERAHELEAAVARATDELREQEARLRQIQKMEAVGQLTGGIAHDFNNMLAVVLGGLDLAKRQISTNPDKALRHIASATEGANRAAALTRQLLAFSREDALKPEALVAGQVVEGMKDLLDRTIGDTITVTVVATGSGWAIRADRHQLENVVLNLAVNARDAMAGRGELSVTTGEATLSAGAVGDCPEGDYVFIAVSDTGCGMTPEVIERVFEPFFTTKPVGKGTGLGLSQVFAFVKQAQGEIAIQSAAGQGTTVTIWLPRHQASDVSAAPALPDSAAANPVQNLTILVVEDDQRVLTATLGVLEELGHQAIACADPLEAPALLAARQGKVDLILSDVLMPGQTGPEMVAALPEDYRHIPVLFVTGFAGEASEAQIAGHYVLRKPFTIASLEAAIAEAMAGNGSADRAGAGAARGSGQMAA